MTVVGVTGTNGKTTTTYLLKQLLERCLGAKVGLIGTNQNMIGDAVLPAERTTPDALTLQRLLREMADAGCTHVVMEVSSHALVQRRAGAIDFALGVFTNLTQDHLDYHGTMEAYCDAKARLFRQCRAAAVNGDDPWTPRLLENVTCPVTRFGQGLANDLVGWDAHYCADRVSFTACSDSEHIPVTLHIPGAFSLYNALAALDLKLRKDMQQELKNIQKATGITFVFVTHDQEEALSMSDTIVVMSEGRIQQIGTPLDIYNEPQNAFVADFIGESNIVDGIMRQDFRVTFSGHTFTCVDKGFAKNENVDVVIRPEDVDIVPIEKGMLRGTVTSVTFMGVHYEIIIDINGFKWMIQTTDYVDEGAEVGLYIEPDAIHIMKKSEYSGMYGDYSSFSNELDELSDAESEPDE